MSASPQIIPTAQPTLSEPAHVVVIGGGAGGLELVTRLGKKLGKRNKAKILSLIHI